MRQLIPERPSSVGGRLGRHLNHDPKNRGYPISAHPLFDPDAPIVAKSWRRARHPLDQGNVGSCEPNAGIRATAQAPNHPRKWYTEGAALKAYGIATGLDPWPGQWPAQDTGTDTVSMFKALQQLGYITEYRWGFTNDELYWCLSYVGPGVLGITWKTGMDHPPASGEIVDLGTERGGHALCVDMIDPNVPGFGGGGVIGGWQSWGPLWPNDGRWIMAMRTWDALREQQADFGIGLP